MKVLLLGANGQLGKELDFTLNEDLQLISLPRSSLDITDHKVTEDLIKHEKPSIIINAAAYTAVDKAESEQKKADAVNHLAVKNLAHLAKEHNAWLIHYSTDYVFEGTKQSPYTEQDTPNPLNIYGATKLAGENAIIESGCQFLIFRTSWVMGAHGNNFAKTILRLAKEKKELRIVADQIGTPTSTSLIASVTQEAIYKIKANAPWPQGIYHLAPRGKTNWFEIAQRLIRYTEKSIPFRLTADDVYPISTSEYPTAAKRPLNSLLETDKIQSVLSFTLPHWEDDFVILAHEIIKA